MSTQDGEKANVLRTCFEQKHTLKSSVKELHADSTSSAMRIDVANPIANHLHTGIQHIILKGDLDQKLKESILLKEIDLAECNHTFIAA